MATLKIAAYSDTVNAEDMSGVTVGDHNYKYRLLNGRWMPPYVTPERYALARSIATRKGDICYTSYPKSGSTWLAHILLLITNRGDTPPEGTLRSHLHWVESFLSGHVQRGDWFDHVLGWWNAAKSAENILFLRYEDLLTGFRTELRRLTEFLGYDLGADVLERIEAKTSFAKMSKDRFSNMSEIEDVETFFRKGEIGSWKAQVSPAQAERFDRMIECRLRGSGLEFRCE